MPVPYNIRSCPSHSIIYEETVKYFLKHLPYFSNLKLLDADLIATVIITCDFTSMRLPSPVSREPYYLKPVVTK